MKTFTTYQTDFGDLSNNKTSDNLTFGINRINEALRYLTGKYYFNETTQNFLGGTVAGQQFYQLPSDIKVMENVYVLSGNIRYSMKECPDRKYWDMLNFVPFSSNVPEFYYIFNGQLGIYPIPSSSNMQLTYVYKKRLVDLSQADYVAGTVTVTNGSFTVTGSGTVFTNQMVGRWLNISETNGGDNQWYQISTYVSSTQLMLANPYNGATVTANYTIGEVPLLPEDYQDLPLYRALVTYFTTVVPDEERARTFKALYDEGFEMLNAEYGAKSNTVDITSRDEEIVNPNLYLRY